jgi:hypothetical protein
VNLSKGILTAPAGNETIVRNPGINRPKKTTMAPYLLNQLLAVFNWFCVTKTLPKMPWFERTWTALSPM